MEELYFILGLVIVVIVLGYGVFKWFTKPSKDQLKDIRQWLIYATLQAEKEFGIGTGALKLRYVYDKFLMRYGFIAKFMSFEQFQALVEEALLEAKYLLEHNIDIAESIFHDLGGSF